MRLTRFEWMTLTKFVVAAWVALLGEVVKHAQAQIPYPVPPPPPPIFMLRLDYHFRSAREGCTGRPTNGFAGDWKGSSSPLVWPQRAVESL
jgi:hypothetical protein